MKELWRPIPGFDKYEVSNKGRVVRLLKGHKKVLRGFIDGSGARVVGLSVRNGERVQRRVHYLVAEAFLLDKGAIVVFLDGNRENACVDNLEWR